MPSSARGSSPQNRHIVEFRGARQYFQAPRPRSRASQRALPKPRHDTQTREGVTLAIPSRVSLAFARAGFHLDSHDRLIVERLHASGMLGNRLEDLVDHAVRRLGGTSGHDRFHTLRPKRLSVAVARVENAVAVEHEQIARLGLESELVVFGFVE